MKFKKGDRVYVEHLDEFGTVTGYVPGQQICVSVLLDINESFGKTLGFNEKELQLVDKAFTDKWVSNIRDGLKGCLEAMNESKKDNINPSHYRAEGIPEAIDIMRGLMTDEQLEGFLWGNIIKYAYRYGRKGDKKETAEKIKWYAEKLAMLNTKELKI
nr:nucleotide kinase [Autographiviridae sp.]